MSENRNGGIKITDEYIRKIEEQRKAEAEAQFRKSVRDFAEAYFELPEEERQALQQDARAGYSMAEKEARHVARMKAREAAAKKPSATAKPSAKPSPSAKSSAGFNFCPYCGFNVNGGFKFCPKCGKPLA